MRDHDAETSIGYLEDNPEDELALESDLTRLAQAEHLLVALDFDGTLAPITEHPEDARMLPEARRAISVLVETERTSVVLVSGRALNSLVQVAQPDSQVMLIGSHGAEIVGEPDEEAPDADTYTGKNLLTELMRSLESRLKQISGVLLEEKPYGVAVHFRNVAEPEVAEVQAILAEHVLQYPDLHTRTGKMVLEFSRSQTNKGEALRILSYQHPDTAVFFAGDDLTDEDVFRILPELSDTHLGVKLGSGPTHAKYRLKTLDQLPPLLLRLDELRSLERRTGLSNPEDSI